MKYSAQPLVLAGLIALGVSSIVSMSPLLTGQESNGTGGSTSSWAPQTWSSDAGATGTSCGPWPSWPDCARIEEMRPAGGGCYYECREMRSSTPSYTTGEWNSSAYSAYSGWVSPYQACMNNCQTVKSGAQCAQNSNYSPMCAASYDCASNCSMQTPTDGGGASAGYGSYQNPYNMQTDCRNWCAAELRRPECTTSASRPNWCTMTCDDMCRNMSGMGASSMYGTPGGNWGMNAKQAWINSCSQIPGKSWTMCEADCERQGSGCPRDAGRTCYHRMLNQTMDCGDSRCTTSDICTYENQRYSSAPSSTCIYGNDVSTPCDSAMCRNAAPGVCTGPGRPGGGGQPGNASMRGCRYDKTTYNGASVRGIVYCRYDYVDCAIEGQPGMLDISRLSLGSPRNRPDGSWDCENSGVGTPQPMNCVSGCQSMTESQCAAATGDMSFWCNAWRTGTCTRACQQREGNPLPPSPVPPLPPPPTVPPMPVPPRIVEPKPTTPVYPGNIQKLQEKLAATKARIMELKKALVVIDAKIEAREESLDALEEEGASGANIKKVLGELKMLRKDRKDTVRKGKAAVSEYKKLQRQIAVLQRSMPVTY